MVYDAASRAVHDMRKRSRSSGDEARSTRASAIRGCVRRKSMSWYIRLRGLSFLGGVFGVSVFVVVAGVVVGGDSAFLVRALRRSKVIARENAVARTNGDLSITPMITRMFRTRRIAIITMVW